jgi:predicted ATP-dependent endonuclease of OLD family
MKATNIYIKNFMGISELQITPGQITVIKGQNGVGKTSVIEALKYIFKAKSDPDIIFKGTDKAEVVMSIDDNIELHRFIKPGKTSLEVTKDSFGINKPQLWLDSMADFISINPLDILFAKPKERLEIMMGALPVKIDEQYLLELTGKAAAGSSNPFDDINKIRKEVFDERTKYNVAHKEKVGALTQLKGSITSMNIPENITELIEKAQLERTELVNHYNELIRKHEGIYNAELLEINQQTQIEIDKIKAAAELRKKELADVSYEKIKSFREDMGAGESAINVKLATLQEQNRQLGALEKTNELIRQYDKEATSLKETSESLTAKLEAVDKYKLDVLGQMPIAGLTIEDGEIYLDGIAFDKLNTAKQILLAVDIALLKSGEFKLLCIDGVERLDANSLDILTNKINEVNAQAILTTVTNDKAMIIEEHIQGMF